MKKKILAVFLSLCMAMSLLPVTALATDAVDEKTPSTKATTLPEAENGVITLEEDVTLSSRYVIKDNAEITIDLAGFTVSNAEALGSEKNDVLIDVQSGSLTIKDSSENQTGKIVSNELYKNSGNSGNKLKCVQVYAGATFTLESGTVENSNTASEASSVINNYGTVNIEGGTVKGVSCISNFASVLGNSSWDGKKATCNINGGLIEGTECESYINNEDKYTPVDKGEGWSWGVALFGPGFGADGKQEITYDKVALNMSDGTIRAGQGIGTNASSGRYAGNTITIDGGTIEGVGDGGAAMYLPAIGKTTINGGTIKGEQGIRICAGELTINGGTINGTAALSPDADLVSGGSGGTEGAIVIGKAGTGYVGDIVVNISENATVQNTATTEGVKPAIVVSDKNMALTKEQEIYNPSGDKTTATFDYSKSGITVNVESQDIKGDVVKVSNNTAGKETQDGGNTSLTLTNANITGNVINQTKEGDVGISGSTITGDVTNKSKGEVVIENHSTITGTVSNEGAEGEKGFVAILDSKVGTVTKDQDIVLVNTTVGGNTEPTTNTKGKVAMIGAKTYDTLQEAINAAEKGETVKLLDDVTVNVPKTVTTKGQGAITINKNITLDGNGKTIYIGTGFAATNGEGWDKDFGKYHVLNITSDATIQNLTIDGGWAGMGKEDSANYSAARTGINIWTNVEDQLDVTLSGVKVKNCSVYAVTAKGADLTITDLTTSGNQWGVDVEDKSTVSIKGSNILENIVYENSSTDTDKNGLTITNGTYGNVVVQGETTKGKVTLNAGNYEGIDNKSTGNAVTIEVTDGSFKESVAQYVTSDLKYEANANGIYTYHKTLEEALKVSDTVSSVEAAKDSTNAVTVTVKNGNDVDTIKLTSGTEYSLLNYPDQGYNHFVGWTDQDGNHYCGGQTVKITANTTFTAQWAYIPPANPNYRIDIPAAEGGTVTADPAAAKAGATVTLTATPDEGYAVGTITVTDRFGDAVKVTENADGTYTFTMPNGQVTVKATFVETEEPAPAMPFTDVHEGDWFYEEVLYAYENGLMNGVGDNRFAPNSATTRGMLVTILYRLEGEPVVTGEAGFDDVGDTWYTDAVIWAAANDIVNGIGDNQFGPENTLTREQLVTMLYRYAQNKGYDVTASADLSGYPDAGQIQSWAQEAMTWAVAEGIVEGMDGNLNPAGSATRAQIATILMRFCEGVAK